MDPKKKELEAVFLVACDPSMNESERPRQVYA